MKRARARLLAGRLLMGAAALLLLPAAAAVAQPAAAAGKWWKRPRIAEALQLSAEQVDALEKIFARVKPKLIDLRADLEKKQFAYQQAMEAERSDRKAVEAAIEAREEARSALQKELALMELDMKQVLKPEQREKLMRMRENAQRLRERRRRLREGAASDDDLLEPEPTPAPTPKGR